MSKLKFQLISGRIIKCEFESELSEDLLESVELIDGRCCELEDFNPKPFKHLEVLLLSSNRLSSFPNCHRNRKLKYIQIYSNNFKEIPPQFVPQSLKEAVIDDIGFEAYPIARIAVTRIYTGYGKISEPLSRVKISEFEIEYTSWREQEGILHENSLLGEQDKSLLHCTKMPDSDMPEIGLEGVYIDKRDAEKYPAKKLSLVID